MIAPWPTKTLEELCEKPQYGFTQSATSEPVGPHFLRITDLRNGALDWKKVPFCQCSQQDLDKFRLNRGDIVVARIGATTGKTALILDHPEAVFASYLIRLRAKEALNPAFLFFFTQAQSYKSWIDANKDNNLKGGVNASILTKLEVPVPPRPEQEKIAALLWKLQRVIETEDRLIATACELKQSTMRQLFTRGLHGEQQKETEIGPIPKSWETAPIRANGNLVAGGTPSRDKPEYWTGGTIPWVKTGEVDYCVITDTEEKITPLGQQNSAAKILPKGTLLIAMYGQGITRGKVAILGIPASTNQACVGIVPSNDKVLPLYLYYFLTFSYERLRSISHGAQQQNLNAELVGSFEIGFPDKDEQSEIASILQTIDRKISVHENKRRTLHELFKTILHQLMAGEIRVADLDIDVSEIKV